MGDEQAETYLRLLAEAELRRAGDQLRDLDAAAGTGNWSLQGEAAFTIAEKAERKVVRAGQILILVGALDEGCLDGVVADLREAIAARSRLVPERNRMRRTSPQTTSGSLGSPLLLPTRRASQAMRVTPVGQALRVPAGRAPCTLHLMSLVRTKTQALITVLMRMNWPPDGSSTDLEITGAGPHHLPYDQLWAVDDQGADYTVRFDAGQGGTSTWRGIAWLSPVPPRRARRLDLVGDGICLIQLPLGSPAARGRAAAAPATEPVVIPPGERLLVLAAESMLANADVRRPAGEPTMGEIVTVLTEAGEIAASSPVPGQLAALCDHLGASGQGITVSPAAAIPAPWASIIAQRRAPVPAANDEVFAPLAAVLPVVDGVRFALAGLSTVAGESHLHVISSGMPRLADQSARSGAQGFSWWLRDGTGNWHVASAGEPHTFGDGMQSFQLLLTPPVATVANAAEVMVTGPTTRVRVTVPVWSERQL